jgi:hypothetical protein
MKKIAAVVLALAATGALALQQLDLNLSRSLLALTGGLLVGPVSLLGSDSQINANRVTRMLGASATIDFASGSIVCTDSAAIAVLGARTGDACFVGPPAAIANNSSFSCYVSAADAVKVRHCPAGTSIDPASASYSVRVISNQ